MHMHHQRPPLSTSVKRRQDYAAHHHGLSSMLEERFVDEIQYLQQKHMKELKQQKAQSDETIARLRKGRGRKETCWFEKIG